MTSVARILLNDGASIPWVGFGTGTALFGRDATAAVRLALATGINHLDGAQMYNNEASLGAGIAASGIPRSSLYVVTKLGALKEGYTVKTQLQESLQKLNLSYVDLFLVHSPKQHEGRLKQVWKEMEEIKKEELAKSIGVSNFKVEHLDEILDGASIVPAINQIEYHPYVFKASQALIKFHKEHGIVTTSYGGLSPLVRNQGGPIDPVLESISKRLQETSGKPVSKGQVLTKWLQQQGIVVATTSSKESRIRETLEVPTLPDLTAEEVQGIEEAGSALHKRNFMVQVFDD